MNATLLCVSLLVQIMGRRRSSKGLRTHSGRVFAHGHQVYMAQTTTDISISGNVCEVGSLGASSLGKRRSPTKGLQTVAGLRDLYVLNISETAVTDRGLHHLKFMKDLEWLSLSGSRNITDAGLRPLESMSNLRRLYLTGCPNIT